MKDERGFSLVELIAAITIMGILLLVAIPNITRSVEKNQKTTYVHDAQKLITVAKKRYKEDTTIAEPTTTRCLVFTLKDLELTDLKGPNDGEYNSRYSYVTITYDASTNKYSYGVQLLETYGKQSKSHRGITYIKDANQTTLVRSKVEQISQTADKYTSLTDLSSGMGSNCTGGVYYSSSSSTSENTGGGAKPGDILTVYYQKGDFVQSLGREKETCTIGQGETSCSIYLPDYKVNDGYTKAGWSTSKNATVGIDVDGLVTLTRDATYYANAKDNTPPQILFLTDADDLFSEEKEIEIKIEDLGSGLASSASIEYGFSLSKTIEPTNYKKAKLNYEDGSKSTTFIVRDKNLNGSFYLWIKPIQLKDKKGNVQKEVIISNGVYNFSGSVPVCTMSGGHDLKIGEQTTFTLSCIDEIVGMQRKELAVADFRTSTDHAMITNVSAPLEITNGYKYEITVQAKSVGVFHLGIPERWMSNNVGTPNKEAIYSNDIYVGGFLHTVIYEKGEFVASLEKESMNCTTEGDSRSCLVTLPDFTPISGFTADGWLNKDTGQVYKIGETISIQGDVHLVAQVIDHEAPKVVFLENGSSTYTKEKTIKVRISDLGSGIKNGASIHYGWSTSNDIASGVTPASIQKAQFTYNEGDKEVTFEVGSKNELGQDYLTGEMYLWLMVENLSDINGNMFTDYYVFSTHTFAFDNEGPQCVFVTTDSVNLGEDATIHMECTDTISGLRRKSLIPSDILVSEGSGLTIKSVSDPIVIANGYKYDIVVQATSNDTAQVILNPGKIFDNLGNANDLIVSDNILTKSKSYTIEYRIGDYVERIEKTTDFCVISKKGETSCKVILPKITPKDGYSVSGWYNDDKTVVSMPEAEYVLSSHVVLTAYAIDDIPPTDVDIDLTYTDGICVSSRTIPITLEDLGSGLASGIQIKYGFTDHRGKEPTSYQTITPTYTAGAKKVVVNIPLNEGVDDLLWVVPINYKDLEGNVNTKTVESAHYFCVRNSITLKENPVQEYHITGTQTVHISLWLNMLDEYKGLDMDTSKIYVFIGALDPKKGGVDYSKKVEGCNIIYNKTTQVLDISIPVNTNNTGELLLDFMPGTFAGFSKGIYLTPNIIFKAGES